MTAAAYASALVLAAALAGATPAPAAGPDPVLGTWATEPGDSGRTAHVEIVPCGATICGTLARAFDSAGRPLATDTLGRRMIWDMVPAGDGRYEGGRIWAPDRDKTYRARMRLSGDLLTVSGCVGPLCRSQTWRRVR